MRDQGFGLRVGGFRSGALSLPKIWVRRLFKLPRHEHVLQGGYRGSVDSHFTKILQLPI